MDRLPAGVLEAIATEVRRQSRGTVNLLSAACRCLHDADKASPYWRHSCRTMHARAYRHERCALCMRRTALGHPELPASSGVMLCRHCRRRRRPSLVPTVRAAALAHLGLSRAHLRLLPPPPFSPSSLESVLGWGKPLRRAAEEGGGGGGAAELGGDLPSWVWEPPVRTCCLCAEPLEPDNAIVLSCCGAECHARCWRYFSRHVLARCAACGK